MGRGLRAIVLLVWRWGERHTHRHDQLGGGKDTPRITGVIIAAFTILGTSVTSLFVPLIPRVMVSCYFLWLGTIFLDECVVRGKSVVQRRSRGRHRAIPRLTELIKHTHAHTHKSSSSAFMWQTFS